MELSINTWSKGLLMDTNPMVQNNDTLTGALNATFITQNGNEVILQNDMGNRRVDNAVLPDGYEPVGIQEYGGIIYIAAYNPITNRSLIGSFPSPERRINEIDDGSLRANVEFSEIFESYEERNLNGIDCLQQDLVLIPLTKDTSLHAGDKFILWTYDNLYSLDNINNITNINNIYESQIDSPKNKLYTLSVGILNSLNEFVDITNTLVRWDSDGNLINTNNLSDLMKFNTGYFIKCGPPEKTLNHDTDADEALKNERELSFQVMKANTYSYKLVGPLYLQVKYNHILDFSYNIYGTCEGKDADLYIEGFITYNCPDGCEYNLNINDLSNDYHSYYEGSFKGKHNFGFDFIVFKDGEPQKEGYKDLGYIKNKYSTNCIYDPSTNLYKVTLIKHIKLTGVENTTIEYVLGVKANLNENNKVYLAGLSTKGILNLNKLGSGEISTTGWRFINNYNKKSGTITYSLDAYPKYEDKFTNITFIFINVADNSNQIKIEAPVNNGKTNLNVEWGTENNQFWERALYKVLITYNTEKGNTTRIDHNEFYLTTELFNSCYSSKSTNSDFVVDYGYPKDNNNSIKISDIKLNNTYSGEALVMYNKLNIDYQITASINDRSDYVLPSNMESKIISKENEKLYIKYTNKYKVNISLDGKYKFNEELYPSYIKLNENLKVSFIPNNNIVKLSDDISTSGALDVSTYKDKIKYQDSIQLDVDTNTILGYLTYYDIFECRPKKGVNVRNCFDSIKNTLETLLKYGSGTKYAAVTLNYEEFYDGSDDKHNLVVSVYSKPVSSYSFDPPGHSGDLLESNQFLIHKKENDGRIDFSTNEDYQNIVDKFNSTLSKETIFTWLFDPYFNYNQYDDDDDNQNNREVIGNASEEHEPFAKETNTYTTSRVWWRTSNDLWALMSNTKTLNDALVTKDKNTTNSDTIINKVAEHLLKYHVKQPFSYAFYKNTRLSDWYGPDVSSESSYIYNNPYNITLSFNLQATNSNTGSVFYELNENLSENILNFYYDNHKIFLDSLYSITVNNLNEAFLDSVDKLIRSEGTVEGYDLGTGLNHDINGNALTTSQIYAIKEYTDLETHSVKYVLNPIDSAPISVDDNYSDEYRSILHKADFPAKASPMYDTTTSDDGHCYTVLTYDSQQIFKYIDS